MGLLGFGDCLRDRYKPLANQKQRDFIEKFSFKIISVSRKVCRRWWDSVALIPWKSSAAEWSQFKRYLKDSAYEATGDTMDDSFDANARNEEACWKRLLGDASYAEELEDDEVEEAAVPRGRSDADKDNDAMKFISVDLNNILSDSWADIPVNIVKGSEVAVVHLGGHYSKIRVGAAVGWTQSELLLDAAPVERRFIVSPDAPTKLFDLNYQELTEKFTHSVAVSLAEVSGDGEWCQVRGPGVPTAVWIGSQFLAVDAPAKGQIDKAGKGNRGKLGKGNKVSSTSCPATLGDLKI